MRSHNIWAAPKNQMIDFRRKNLANWWNFEMLQMRADTGLLHTADPNFNFTLTNDLNISSEVSEMLMLMLYKYMRIPGKFNGQFFQTFSKYANKVCKLLLHSKNFLCGI